MLIALLNRSLARYAPRVCVYTTLAVEKTSALIFCQPPQSTFNILVAVKIGLLLEDVASRAREAGSMDMVV